MQNYEQVKFVDELIENVRIDIQKQISQNWEQIQGWDGHELRQYIADKFSDAVFIKMNKARMKEYRNTVLIHNL